MTPRTPPGWYPFGSFAFLHPRDSERVKLACSVSPTDEAAPVWVRPAGRLITVDAGDPEQVAAAGRAVLRAFPHHWDVHRRKDAARVAERLGRAVLAELAASSSDAGGPAGPADTDRTGGDTHG